MGMNQSEIKKMSARLFLHSVETIGPITIKRLLEIFTGGAEELWECSENKLKASGILNQRQLNNFVQVRDKWDGARKIEQLLQKKIRICTLEDTIYPEKLRDIVDSPYLLYYYGALPQIDIPSVSIIGARMCSEYGKEMARKFAGELASKGVQIVSGMASGIDGLSQKAAMEAGGQSFGILGCGVDICYPTSNRELYEKLKMAGGVISEFPPGEKPLAQNFPRRNRIISGLADIVLVIEAKEKSGTAITVQMALEQGKEIFAIPGRNIDPLSKGCNRLIREGAGIAMEPGDVLDCLKVMGYEEMGPAFSENAQVSIFDYLSENREEGNSIEIVMSNILRDKPQTVEQIYMLVNQNKYNYMLEIPELNAVLAKMELMDMVVCHGGVWEIRL